MKAAILVEQNKPLVIGDITSRSLEVGQVLVKVAYSGICGKQLEEIDGKRGPDPYLPHLLGHEGSGEVIEVGPGVRNVERGDHVVMHWIKSHGIDSAPPRLDWSDTVVSAGWVTTFSECSVISENRLTRIPKDIPLDIASLMGCAVTTGFGIVFNDAALTPGKSIAIFGVGGIGLNVVQGASLVNAYPIVAIDLHDRKLNLAREFGATHIINSSHMDPGSMLMELSGGLGLDAVVDTTGNTAIRELAYRNTTDVGKTIFAGVPFLNAQISIDSFPLHFGRSVRGSHGGNTQPAIDIPRYLKLYQQGKLDLKKLITHRIDLEKINDAVCVVRSGDAGRCVISMH